MHLTTLTFKATHTYMCVYTYIMFVGGSAFCLIDRCLPEQAVARAVSPRFRIRYWLFSRCSTVVGI